MKKLLSSLLFLLATVGVQAQIEIDSTALNMGQVEWYGDGVAAVVIKNVGDRAVVIKDVQTSSSLLKAEWTQEPIASGQSGRINVSYHADLLGQFGKAIYVYTDEREQPYVMHVSGVVVTEKDDYAGDFPYHVGDIFVSTDNIEFFDTNRGERPVQVLTVKNNGKTVYHPELMHLPKYLAQQAEPDKVLPGRTGKLYVMLLTDQMEGFGLKQEKVYLSRFSGDKVGADNELEVSTVVLPPFDTTSVVQTALAPVLEMDKHELTLPSLDARSSASGTVALKNVGKSSLEITALQVFHPALNVKLGHMKIAPGRTEKLHIKVLQKYLKESRSRLRVLLITNDPKHPKEFIDIKFAKKR